MTPSYPDLAGRSVFLTGGGSGIGAVLTESFVAQGAHVAFVQRSDAGELCDRIASEHGTRPLFLSCDVTDPAALRQAMATAAEAHGPIRTLICNAANDMRRDTLTITPEQWTGDLAINLGHYLTAAQAAIPAMRAAGGGAIVNMSSVSYLMGMGGMAAYTSANAGITALTRSLARDYGGDGIRVNAVAPGMVVTDTQLDKWLTPESIAEQVDRQCLKRHLTPADIVGPVLFLASEASVGLAGQCLIADGGVVFSG